MKKSAAVKHFGSQFEIARVLGIGRSAVCQWGKIVPEARQAKLSEASGGKLKIAKPKKPNQKNKRG